MTAALAVTAALGGYLLTHHSAARPASRAALDERTARDLTEGYRRDAVAQMPAALRYAEAVHSFVACPGAPGRYTLSTRFDLFPETGSAAPAFPALRAFWRQRGYRTINDTPGQNPQLLVENPTDGFRIGVSLRTARYLRLAIASPCLTPAAPPVPPVLLSDLATARDAYLRYAAGQLAQLAGNVGTLRAAVATGDTARARAAWLTAQLCWERLGAAYGSFGDSGTAIDGLPQGLPRGTADPSFTGLHRIEYGLWHGEPTASLLSTVDRLAGDLATLRANLVQVGPEPADLPLRAHEILEDAQRDHITRHTDFGGGAGYAATMSNVDATVALLDILGSLVDARRPGLLPVVRAGLDALRQALQAAQTPGGWISPQAASPALRQRVDAALGAVLENLAAVPGLLEMAGS
ncbi:MAG TPA: EfeM/EfeO family lipoprotein [Rugosimonospora sp.]|nr:EfeM/EfeO family lipoprotein [Rugosimonospora sp.]